MQVSKSFALILVILIGASDTLTAQQVSLTPVKVIDAEMTYPTDICGNGKGDVFILDGLNDRVVMVKASGEVKGIKPQRESFYKAVGIAWIGGDLWIADTPRSRLLKMNLDGRITQVVKLDRQIEPVDLTAVGDLIAVTDRLNHSITVFDPSFKEKYHWGKRGDKVGEFINPGFVAAGPENRLIIGDILNRRVMSYSPSGRYPQIIVKPGVQQGQVFRPKGILVDQTNRVWVADGYTGSLQLFSVAGKYLGLASQNGNPLVLDAPMGLYLDGNDQLWVVESFSSKVSVWKVRS